MRAGIENWLLRHWYGPGQPPWFLRMLEPIYRAAFQRSQKNAKSAGKCRSGVPVVVVGNITAGGSGKTPLVIWLCQLALEIGLKPGIASTGYGRHSRDTLLVRHGGDARTYGDEPLLLAARTGVPVAVAAKRLDAVKKLNDLNLDLIISDDGLQTADLARDIEFCVIDGERGLGNGHLLPAGPLREPESRLSGVDYIVSNGNWAGKPDSLDVSVMSLMANGVSSLDGSEECSVEEFRHRHNGIPLHAVAGIGNPQRFFRMLESLGIKANSHAFPDHHAFRREDFDSISDDAAFIMTEKDAVKCLDLGLKNAWYMPVETRLPGQFEDLLRDQLVKLKKDC